MPIVFVHGVANRSSQENDELVALRRRMFKATVLKHYLGSEDDLYLSPMWGDLVPEFPKPNPIIPSTDMSATHYVALGGAEADDAMLPSFYVGVPLPKGQRLLALARQSFPSYIDQIWQAAALSPQIRSNAEQFAELAEAGISIAGYAIENPRPAWLDAVKNDKELKDKFAEELEKWRRGPRPDSAPKPTPSSGGVGVSPKPTPTSPTRPVTVEPPAFQALGVTDKVIGWLHAAAERLEKVVVDVPNDLALELVRQRWTNKLVLFFGDVFSYLANRGTKEQPGPIPTRVLQDLLRARAEADKFGRKLVVVAHSMGGNIMYDLLTYFKPDLNVDDLVTIGCQASVFKQLELFQGQVSGTLPGGVGKDKAPRPPNLGRWINIFDPQDVLSFAFDPEFQGVTDFYFESPGSTFTAHGDYFQRIRFYERLLVRLNQPVTQL
jgi:hypothetical protein